MVYVYIGGAWYDKDQGCYMQTGSTARKAHDCNILKCWLLTVYTCHATNAFMFGCLVCYKYQSHAFTHVSQ